MKDPMTKRNKNEHVPRPAAQVWKNKNKNCNEKYKKYNKNKITDEEGQE